MSSKTTQSRQRDINWKTKAEWYDIGYTVEFAAVGMKVEGMPPLYNKDQVYLRLPPPKPDAG